MMSLYSQLAVVTLFLQLTIIFIEMPSNSLANPEANPGGYGHGHGHGHGHKAHGTACIVKGSYCNCHYCKCEKGHIHCGGYGKGHGKKYCYGSMQGEYCHCDYCKCKHGYGSSGYGKCH